MLREEEKGTQSEKKREGELTDSKRQKKIALKKESIR